MKRLALVLILTLTACGEGSAPPAQAPRSSVSAANGLPSAAATPAAMESKMPVPADKAQLKRMLAMGYTVHEDHLHPPGVKECAFDKAGGSVVQ